MFYKNHFLTILASFLIIAVGCKPKEKVSKSEPAKAAANLTYSAPGKLQFEAKSNLYEALAEFRDWKFTEIKFANKANLNGLTTKLSINTNSVFEKTIRLTQDLKTMDYFDVKKYPEANIKIYEVKSINDTLYSGKMEVKIKNKKLEKPFEFSVIQTQPNYRVKGQVILQRETFEIGMSMPSIESQVKVIFETELKLP